MNAHLPSRRMILLGGLGATGALVVGYAVWPSHRLERDDALAAKPNEKFISNWIKIATDGTITVVVPHCDMGTGIFTALPQMAAEELDADWGQVRSEAAPPDPLFANGALAEGFILSGQDMTADDLPAFLRGTVANTFRTVAGFMSLQVTGGSSAIRFTGVYGMRLAGAAAREMLVKAAAARWSVDAASCTTKASRVLHAASGRSLGYGELVADAATYTPSSNPTVKPRSQYTLVGKPIPRFDIPKKVDGTTNYGLDVKQPGMLYAAIKISPVFGGKLTSVDAAPIAQARGIKKIVYLNDAVVVVADRFWRARDAVAALDPKWDNAGNGGVTSGQIAARHTAALRGADLKKDVTKGNGADALAGGRLVEATYTVPYLSHAPMEPMNATALWKDGELEVWSGTQDGLGARAFCAKTANLPFDKVTYHLMPMGGGFGRRLPGYFNFLEHAVKTAMALPGIPVKLIYTRDQDMQHDYYRPNVTSHFRAALDGNGMPLAWVNDYTTDTGANAEAHIVYGIDNQALRTAKVETHVPVGPWRSVEASWHGFFIESFVDELAHAAGKDPLAFRRSLLTHAPRHLAALNLAAEKAGWGTPLPQGRARGIAMFESFQTIVAHVVEITLAPNGALKVDRVVTAVDAGMAVNPDGMRAQIEGGIIYGLTAALNGEITIDKGAVVQANFPDYEMVRLAECPQIEVHLITSDAPLGGAGEPGVPPLAPAIANAIFAASGTRIRELPVKNHNLTVAQR
ncbi:MAG TPA: molybdopterin cofactor-binding domain-containing protein [Rhizomicrobium sp.]|jgi:isoquinoline 1-oxidoreductase beta subunit|nr:molybdopterin cofactor-binding domain-containing protein [Rhizomicrobium sp.]